MFQAMCAVTDPTRTIVTKFRGSTDAGADSSPRVASSGSADGNRSRGPGNTFCIRAAWNPQALFTPLLKECLAFCPGKLVGVAVDDTRLRKTGRSIPQAAWHRDPMSPPFHANLMLGLRFLQASLLLCQRSHKNVEF
jgi:hypothetical protein